MFWIISGIFVLAERRNIVNRDVVDSLGRNIPLRPLQRVISYFMAK